MNRSRRKFCFAFSSGLLAMPFAWSSAWANNAPIMIDTRGVKTLDDLILAIRSSAVAAGKRLPDTLTTHDFYREFVRVAVENSQRAAELNIAIPEELLKYVRSIKVSTQMASVGVLVFFTLGALTFGMPIGAFFGILIASWTLLFALMKPKGKQAPPPSAVPAGPKKMHLDSGEPLLFST